MIVNDRQKRAILTSEERDLITWHQRCGHLNVSELKNMKNNDIVLGMKFASQTSEINCETCAKYRIHVKPFKPPTHEKEILSLIHSDIFETRNIKSVGGVRYFLTFIDDYSRYMEVVMLRNKFNALQVFKNYKRKVENLTGKRPSTKQRSETS